jgi:glycosyltransferase involved in cell wall biosynthesis
MEKIAVIIPAYNEESNLPDLLQELKQQKIEGYKLQPIVVNDCSKDQTAHLARQSEAILIDLPVNLGIGGAVQSGMIYALRQGFQFAVQVDGDGQHPPAEIKKLVKAQEESKANIIIGSRFLSGEGFQSSRYRRTGIIYLKQLIKLLTGKIITDATSGFRLYDRSALESISNYYPDEYPEPEAIIYFHKRGLKIEETQVQMRHRQGGKSSISFINSFYYFWKVSLAIFYSYLKA